jgi:hypothetical protein
VGEVVTPALALVVGAIKAGRGSRRALLWTALGTPFAARKDIISEGRQMRESYDLMGYIKGANTYWLLDFRLLRKAFRF